MKINDKTWSPHPGPQTNFMSRNEFEVLYGGARGGGKSECLLMESLRYISYSDYRAILFRRTFPELQDLIDRSKMAFGRIFPGAVWRSDDKRWEFPSGAIIRFAHMQEEASKYLVMGLMYHFMGFDELTHFTESQYIFAIGSCRSTNKEIPARVRATSNPGNIGHEWVRRRFVKVTEPGKTYKDKRTGMTRCFIPASVYDNPTITENDPEYVKRLEALPWREREMMLHGNWDVFAGQAFPEWRYEHHVIKPFKIPHEWTRFIAMDWGYSRPFAILWFAQDFFGKLYVYKEWYGIAYDEYDEPKENLGAQLGAIDVASGIKQRVQSEKIEYLVCDPSIWAQAGHASGSITDDLQRILRSEGILIIPGNNDRMSGKNQVHMRLRTASDGKPSLLIFSTCLHGIRTLPSLPVDENKPEDVNKRAEDHWYDALRYGCMSKPMTDIMIATKTGQKRTVNRVESFRLKNFGPMRGKRDRRIVDTYYGNHRQ